MRMQSFVVFAFVVFGMLTPIALTQDQEPLTPAILEQRLAKYYAAPDEFAGKFGDYRSPLRLADGQLESFAA